MGNVREQVLLGNVREAELGQTGEQWHLTVLLDWELILGLHEQGL